MAIHVDQVIPNNLCLFLSLLSGGINVVEEGITEEDPSIKQTVCNIDQVFVCAVSNKQKHTPKYIALGLAVKQVTRFEALLDLFHAANQIIGIDNVRRIDTFIAQNIRDKLVENCNIYVPDCSCDNIDILETNLNGNIFHCTQIIVWQRGSTAQEHYVAGKPILRHRAIKPYDLQAFQQLDPAVLPSEQRILPYFGCDKKIEEERFINSGDKI